MYKKRLKRYSFISFCFGLNFLPKTLSSFITTCDKVSKRLVICTRREENPFAKFIELRVVQFYEVEETLAVFK